MSQQPSIDSLPLKTIEAMEQVELGRLVRDIVLKADDNSNTDIWRECSALFAEQSARVAQKNRKAPLKKKPKAKATAKQATQQVAGKKRSRSKKDSVALPVLDKRAREEEEKEGMRAEFQRNKA